MDKTKSALAVKFGGAETINQAFGSSKDAVVCAEANAGMIPDVLLIWLGNNIDENNEDCQYKITQLQRVVNTVNTFTDSNQCINFLREIPNKKVCMIISDALCRNNVPPVHGLAQLHHIFILCEDKTKHEQWAKEWSKVKGVFTEILPICRALEQAVQQWEQNAISMSFVNTSEDLYSKHLNQLDPSFMYTQILKEILLSIEFEEEHVKEFIDYCRVDRKGKLNNVSRLEQEYHDQKPIVWYTSESFLYSMLNHDLRLMDVNGIIKMGCFVRDLHRDIEQLHNEQFGAGHSNKSFTLFRGQGMSEVDFDQMKKTKGGLISFNNFLSTSKSRAASFAFAESNGDDPNLVGILFVLTINPSESRTPFASIDGLSDYQDEEEVLFSMHTVFRIDDIKSIDENDRLSEVHLTLTSKDDKDLRVLTDRIRKETFSGDNGWFQLGTLLLEMGQFDKAQQLYEIILGQTVNESEKAPIYHQLALANNCKGEYQEAIMFYEKVLEIEQKTRPANHPDLVSSYINISNVYYNMGEYSKAFSFCDKALNICQNTLSPSHLLFAASYSNIAAVYNGMGEYSKARSSFEKALEIQQQSLPFNHPDITSSYNNIAAVCDDLGEYSQALSSYEKALEIRHRSLPSNHPDIASSYNNIGLVYYNMGDYSKALLSYGKALAMKQKGLPSSHPSLAATYTNMGVVYRNMGDYSKALSSYKKAFLIQQESLPSNHPDLAASYNNFGDVYYKMGEHSKALLSHEKSLEIKQKVLPPNHPDLAASYGNIGSVYDDMGEYSKALSFYDKALEIRQIALPPNHPDLASSYNDIGVVYKRMDEYVKALSFYERAVDIGERSLPPNHPALQGYKKNLDFVKTKL